MRELDHPNTGLIMKIVLQAFLLAVGTLLFTTALGLAVISTTGFPYQLDLRYLNISETSGLSRAEIMSNYRAVLSYMNPFSAAAFSLPSLNYTAASIRHFDDCKVLFNAVYLMGEVSGLFLALGAFMRILKKPVLWLAGILTLVIPALMMIVLATNFDRAFILFHTLFFQGNSWRFNPQTDGIIRILPETFFMHCGLFIALFWLIGAAALLLLSRGKNVPFKKRRSRL